MIAVLTEIGQIAAAVAALAGIIVAVWKYWLNPKLKARKQAAKDGQQAVDDGDTAGITGAFDRLNRK